MSENTPHDFQEPPISPDDTHPTGTYPQVPRETGSYPAIYPEMQTRPVWVKLLGGAVLLAVVGVLVIVAFVLLNPDDDEPETTPEPTQPQVVQQPTDLPATPLPVEATTVEPIDNSQADPAAALPTLDSQIASALLEAPLQNVALQQAGRFENNPLNPFTIVPDRPRTEVLQYTAVRGDTIEEISIRYNLEAETIAWSNKRSIIQVLRPGDVVNIPPEDGVFIRTVGSTRTIRDYTEEYKIDDVFKVLDHPANTNLLGLGPDSVPPSNTPIFFPGGEGPEVIWVADSGLVENSGSSGSSGSGASAARTAVFQNGQPGSCAAQSIEGLGSVWVNPVSGGYSITRGFSAFHSGIDLAGSTGTPVVAANLGRVVFSGWNTFGYGNTVAVVHGPTMTVYAHLQFAPTVGCGQVVNPGEVIGLMGSTGNSTGPHLHFEIRNLIDGRYVPSNPVIIMSF